MENRGSVNSLPNVYRFKKTALASRNAIATLGRHKGVILNKRRSSVILLCLSSPSNPRSYDGTSRFSLGSSSSSSGNASNYSGSSSRSSFRLSLPEPLVTAASGEIRHLPSQATPEDISCMVLREEEDLDGEWEEKSLGLVWRNSCLRPSSRYPLAEAEEDAVEEADPEEAETRKENENEQNRLREDQERRIIFIVSMLNYLYKVLKKQFTDNGSAITGRTKASAIQQDALKRKAKEEVLENLFNTTYEDLKFLEMLKEIFLIENGTRSLAPDILLLQCLSVHWDEQATWYERT